MQLGIRLHDIKKAPLEERLAIAKEQGFRCGHIALSKVISEYSVDDAALTPGLAMYLKKQFAHFTNQQKQYAKKLFLQMARCDGFVDPREMDTIDYFK